MRRLVFSPAAKQDLVAINRYLIRYSTLAARRFKGKVRRQSELLIEFPAMGRSADSLQPGLRSFPVEDYLIFYTVNSNTIEILRILNGYRNLEAIFSEDIEP